MIYIYKYWNQEAWHGSFCTNCSWFRMATILYYCQKVIYAILVSFI